MSTTGTLLDLGNMDHLLVVPYLLVASKFLHVNIIRVHTSTQGSKAKEEEKNIRCIMSMNRYIFHYEHEILYDT